MSQAFKDTHVQAEDYEQGSTNKPDKSKSNILVPRSLLTLSIIKRLLGRCL